MDKAELPNIEPFNEVFYRNCFYNSLFPIIHHFNKDIMNFFVNSTFIYSNESKLGLSIDFKGKDRDEIIRELGLSVEQKSISSEIIKDITCSITHHKPVIIYVDCFYESICRDTFKKIHHPHSLLIYGFNHKTEEMNIIEHKNRDSLLYEKKVISYKGIKESYQGFLEYFLEEMKVNTFYSYDINKERNDLVTSYDQKYYLKILYQCMYENKKMIYHGLEFLDEFKEKTKKLLLNKNEFDLVKNEIMQLLNDIINSKRVELYRWRKLNVDYNSRMVKTVQEIADSWNEIRAIVVKYIFSSVNDGKSLEYAVKRLGDVIYDENEYNEAVFSFLYNYK